MMHGNYVGAPSDGSAWIEGGQTNGEGIVSHPLRGGGLRSTDRRVRTASRHSYAQTASSYYVGFRITCLIETPRAGAEVGSMGPGHVRKEAN